MLCQGSMARQPTSEELANLPELCVVGIFVVCRCPCPENVANGDRPTAPCCSKKNVKLYSGVYGEKCQEKMMNHLMYL